MPERQRHGNAVAMEFLEVLRPYAQLALVGWPAACTAPPPHETVVADFLDIAAVRVHASLRIPRRRQAVVLQLVVASPV
jgi:hypothetical protein